MGAMTLGWILGFAVISLIGGGVTSFGFSDWRRMEGDHGFSWNKDMFAFMGFLLGTGMTFAGLIVIRSIFLC